MADAGSPALRTHDDSTVGRRSTNSRFHARLLLAYLDGFFHWPSWLKGAAVLMLFASTIYLEIQFDDVLWGGSMYLPSILFLIGAGIGFWRLGMAGKAFFSAVGLFILSFALRTIDITVCSYLPIGTHYFWHIFNAAVLYLLVRTLILHAPSSAGTTRHSSSNGTSMATASR
jgi:hypothetical protein